MDEKEVILLRSIGDRIRLFRLKNNLSQSQLGFEIKSDGRHVRRIEKGETKMNVILLVRISKILNCHLTDLVLLAE